MRATSISVNVRYSKPMPDGSHKTVELGCEATLSSSGEDWQTEQQTLYKQLGEQMRYVFKGNGKAEAQEGHQKPVQASESQGGTDSQHPDAHYCEIHGVQFKARVNKQTGEPFYSHRQGGGWCNEK
jgi:hypothetical protein